jgi:alginate O-acetyltransferase complex protein AlgI
MDFIKPSFIFLFLPVIVIFHALIKEKYRNIFALIASLIFYASGDLIYLPILLFLAMMNYMIARSFENNENNSHRTALVLGVVLNGMLLVSFKFISQYGSASIFSIFPAKFQNIFDEIAVPLGLSYITFQNISYLVDVSNKIVQPEKNFLNYFMYISFFPKIINGPIVQYKQISDQLQYRDLEIKKVAQGARRFILGLAKKVLIADIIARTINPCFNLSSPDFSTGIAWFLLIGYTIQIYFDFSGYSDMALGLAGMMGFTFGENFNYPYIAESITDFWRRWHISLSNWVREYIFIPLEFKRRKSKFFRQQIDFLITFLVTGLWHGLTPNFIIWGAIHGLAMGAESGFFAKMLKRVWKPLQHVYTLAIVMLGWIFFRPATTSYSIKFLGRLVGLGSSVPIIPYNMTAPLPIIDTSVWIAIGLGILLSTPLLSNLLKGFQKKRNPSQQGIVQLIQDGFTLILFLLSVASIASSGYVGSIYGNF